MVADAATVSVLSELPVWVSGVLALATVSSVGGAYLMYKLVISKVNEMREDNVNTFNTLFEKIEGIKVNCVSQRSACIGTFVPAPELNVRLQGIDSEIKHRYDMVLKDLDHLKLLWNIWATAEGKVSAQHLKDGRHGL